MPANPVRFGPGELTLGTTPGTDFSCSVQSLAVVPTKDEGDAIRLLCGDSIPGSINYSFNLTGTILQDIGVAAGLAQYCWENMGLAVEFTYTPSTSATTAVAGTCIVDPVTIGTSDGEVGDVLTSDIEFSIVGIPAVTWPAAA
jgi:hypothetical protein